MKMPTFLPTMIVVVFASAALTGCNSKPVDELKMTRTAREQARNTEAPEYDPYGWDRAGAQWEEANALIQMGRYSEARSVLIEAAGNYNKAREEAIRRLESIKIEIKALQSSAESELKHLEHDVSGKATPSVRNRIDRALPLIEEKIATMNADYDAKEYLRSRMAGHAAIRYMQELQERVGIHH
jgi:hypothetical protein